MSGKLPTLKVSVNHGKNLCTAYCSCGKWDAWGPANQEQMIQKNADLHYSKHRERGS